MVRKIDSDDMADIRLEYMDNSTSSLLRTRRTKKKRKSQNKRRRLMNVVADWHLILARISLLWTTADVGKAPTSGVQKANCFSAIPPRSMGAVDN